MLNVLLNAYACNPYWGSEQGIGWHWSIELAKYCKVFVITEGEFRSNIETALVNLPQKRNLVFIYNNVSARVRRMCWSDKASVDLVVDEAKEDIYALKTAAEKDAEDCQVFM